MQDILTILADLRRPRLLIRAARAGIYDYRRDLHLKRHIGVEILPNNGAALMRMIEIEAVFDQQRRHADAAYSLISHVDILIAMMGEARLLRAAQSQA